MNITKTKKFNLSLAKAGKKFQTKLGNPARFITVANNGLLIIAVKDRYGQETAEKYNINGIRWHHSSSLFDLEMVNAYNETNN